MRKVGLISTGRESLSGFHTNLKLVNCLQPLCDKIIWIAVSHPIDKGKLPERVTMRNPDLGQAGGGAFLGELFRDPLRQMRMAFELAKVRREADVFILDCGYTPVLLLLFITWFLRRKAILRVEGRGSMLLRESPAKEHHRAVRMVIHSLMEMVGYALAHRLVVGSEGMVERNRLGSYAHKISIINQYVDSRLFKETREFSQRHYDIGYFGRLAVDKGALSFAQSLPLVMKGNKARAVMVGDGNLAEELRAMLAENGVADRVKLTGWVETEQVPAYLNDVKLLVLPSSREGIPSVVLEAMACGTLVLATAVGGVPDLVRDGVTGFIMEDSSPECIARNIVRALGHPDIEAIRRNARALVEKEYSYELAISRCKAMLGDEDSD